MVDLFIGVLAAFCLLLAGVGIRDSEPGENRGAIAFLIAAGGAGLWLLAQ